MEDLSRNVSLYCSVYGNDQFEFDSKDDSTNYKCIDCGKEYTKEELLEVNEYVINANIEDIKDEAVSEIEKGIKKI
ncbi:MAG: hypothetical protein Q4Q07_04445 [Tissierellia bacterium]|nr:hypothetical protein [Tissierellia bacterium]